MRKITNIGIICSGGDAPGMNPTIRAVVRTAINSKMVPWGIFKGFDGLIDGNIEKLTVSSVGNILQQGGTILGSGRSTRFLQKSFRNKAFEQLRKKRIQALIILGGDGSFNGAHVFYQEQGIPTIGIPCTIDNDISATEYTVGLHTAIQTAVDAVDKIRDTATAHDRIFLVELMGHQCPILALHAGISSGAEHILIPKQKINYDDIAHTINRGIKRGKNSSIIIVSEGKKPGRSYRIQKELKKRYDFESRVCVLGHIQRGGSPNQFDRFIGSLMGHNAIAVLNKLEKPAAMAMTFIKGRIYPSMLEKCLKKSDHYSQDLIELAKTLAI